MLGNQDKRLQIFLTARQKALDVVELSLSMPVYPPMMKGFSSSAQSTLVSLCSISGTLVFVVNYESPCWTGDSAAMTTACLICGSVG